MASTILHALTPDDLNVLKQVIDQYRKNGGVVNQSRSRSPYMDPEDAIQAMPRFRRGVLTTTVAAGEASTGTVQPKKWDSGTNSWVNDGATLNGRAGVPLADEIPSGKVVWFWREFNVWWFLLAEC